MMSARPGPRSAALRPTLLAGRYALHGSAGCPDQRPLDVSEGRGGRPESRTSSGAPVWHAGEGEVAGQGHALASDRASRLGRLAPPGREPRPASRSRAAADDTGSMNQAGLRRHARRLKPVNDEPVGRGVASMGQGVRRKPADGITLPARRGGSPRRGCGGLTGAVRTARRVPRETRSASARVRQTWTRPNGAGLAAIAGIVCDRPSRAFGLAAA
jgi:hypothetical protein